MRIYAVYPDVGTRFGSLVVTSGPFYPEGYSKRTRFVSCRCDCGGTDIARLSRLRQGEKIACRRCEYSASNKRHGDSESVEFSTWMSVLHRAGVTSGGSRATTTSMDATARKSYLDRGITVCRRWLKYENFLADMGRRPAGCTSIDRKNNDKGYSPANCRWATRGEQANNKRNNIFVEHEGERLSLSQWAQKLGFIPGTLIVRYRAGYRPPELFRPTYPRTHRKKP